LHDGGRVRGDSDADSASDADTDTTRHLAAVEGAARLAFFTRPVSRSAPDMAACAACTTSRNATAGATDLVDAELDDLIACLESL